MLTQKIIVGTVLATLFCLAGSGQAVYVPPEAGHRDIVEKSAWHGLEGLASQPVYKTGEVLVKFKPGFERNPVGGLARESGALVKRKLRLRNNNVYLLTVAAGQEARVITKLRKNPNVIYAELNGYMYALDQLIPDDPNFGEQWALNNTGQWYPWDGRFKEPPGTAGSDVNAPEGWYDVNDAFGRIGDSNVIIAILDTGVDADHADLADSIGTGGYAGYDFVNDDNDPSDDNGHGTHCAGIAAAVTNNSTHIAGVAGGCTIMPVKVLNANGGGTEAQIAEGIDYAADPNHQADVISLSLGGPFSAEVVEEAIVDAYESGCVVVVAAGNTSNDHGRGAMYPALYPEVITVSATDSDDEMTPFSSYGAAIDVAAPGVDILSLRAAGTDMYDDGDHFYPDGDPNAEMYIACGTSMSCPHVAGLAGLCRSVEPNLTPEDIRWLIRNSSDDLGDKGWDKFYGAGRINVYRAAHGLTAGVSKATNPYPANSASSQPVNVDLSWEPGYYALWHHVYFGADFNDVNDANTSSNAFKGSQRDNLFDQETLEANSTYYWRTDESNGTETSKGDVWSFSTDANSGIYYVDADANSGGDGLSWSTAFDDLQDALEAVTCTGDEIWAAEGTYKPTDGTDRSVSFELPKGVELYGGFAGIEKTIKTTIAIRW
jgi:subtilisin family serine protease